MTMRTLSLQYHMSGEQFVVWGTLVFRLPLTSDWQREKVLTWGLYIDFSVRVGEQESGDQGASALPQCGPGEMAAPTLVEPEKGSTEGPCPPFFLLGVKINL